MKKKVSYVSTEALSGLALRILGNRAPENISRAYVGLTGVLFEHGAGEYLAVVTYPKTARAYAFRTGGYDKIDKLGRFISALDFYTSCRFLSFLREDLQELRLKGSNA